MDRVITALHCINALQACTWPAFYHQNTIYHGLFIYYIIYSWRSSFLVYRLLVYIHVTNGLLQERRNSSALAMELHLSCTNPMLMRSFSDDALVLGSGKMCPVAQATDLLLTVMTGVFWYRGCWCPGSLPHQVISSHGTHWGINKSLFSMRINFHPPCAISVFRKYRKCKHIFFMSLWPSWCWNRNIPE